MVCATFWAKFSQTHLVTLSIGAIVHMYRNPHKGI
jgi:hypothetical protein